VQLLTRLSPTNCHYGTAAPISKTGVQAFASQYLLRSVAAERYLLLHSGLQTVEEAVTLGKHDFGSGLEDPSFDTL
jgi:hypothetical protein